MHAFIRVQLRKPFGETFAREVPLLYGGSMKPNNAATLLLQQDVDGGLIGGAKSLDITSSVGCASCQLNLS